MFKISIPALRIHVSPECRAILEELDGFYFEYRGKIEMKVG